MSQIQNTVRSTFREWGDFRRQTGAWPVLSILTSIAFFLGLFLWIACYTLYALRKGSWRLYTKILQIPLIVIYAIVWTMCERYVRGYEIRKARRARHERAL